MFYFSCPSFAIHSYPQNIIERFPASLIKEPTAFTSNGPTELYNNILVFIVDGGTGSRSEMHIFQVNITINQYDQRVSLNSVSKRETKYAHISISVLRILLQMNTSNFQCDLFVCVAVT